MNQELKQFLYDQKRFKQGLPAEPLPFTHNPRPPTLDAPDPVPAQTQVLKVSAPAPKHLSPSQLRRRTAHMAQFGKVFDPNYQPPTQDQLFQRLPQLCRECGNGWCNRILLPPDDGKFFKDARGIRWVCWPCIAKHTGESDTSPGENRLHALLDENGIKHTMRDDVEGTEVDCYIPKWNLIVEVDSWSAHHTAVQKKKDHHRNKLAKKLGIHLLRVKWNDREMLVKVLRARQRGLALRKQSKLVKQKNPVPKVRRLAYIPYPEKM